MHWAIELNLVSEKRGEIDHKSEDSSGSVNSIEWMELRRHTGSGWFGNRGDTSIQGDKSAAWPLVDSTGTTAFRYLRIRQTGDNAHADESKRSVLFLSGFEVFGTLLESISVKKYHLYLFFYYESMNMRYKNSRDMYK